MDKNAVLSHRGTVQYGQMSLSSSTWLVLFKVNSGNNSVKFFTYGQGPNFKKNSTLTPLFFSLPHAFSLINQLQDNIFQVHSV